MAPNAISNIVKTANHITPALNKIIIIFNKVVIINAMNFTFTVIFELISA